MLSQLAPSAQKQKSYLHLLLVIGVFLYVYTPILDHQLGSEYYVRPHTHISIFTHTSTLHLEDTENLFLGNGEHSDHEENVLCLLDIKTLVYVPFNISVALIVQYIPLIFDLLPYYMQGSTIYLPSLDPPPRIYS